MQATIIGTWNVMYECRKRGFKSDRPTCMPVSNKDGKNQTNSLKACNMGLVVS